MVKADKAIVLLDMDGVITDLVSGVEDFYETKFDFHDGVYRFTDRLKIPMSVFEEDLNLSGFWEDLKPTKYMPEIFQILEDQNLYDTAILCTQGIFKPRAHAGRLRWIRKYCPDFWERKAYISIQDKSLLAKPNRILIDDYAKNTIAFQKAGGWAIEFIADWNVQYEGVNPVWALDADLDQLLIGDDDGEA